MDDTTPLPDPSAKSRVVQHEATILNGEDAYPPELLAQARANTTPGPPTKSRVVRHELTALNGEDVYPPELLAQARANTYGK